MARGDHTSRIIDYYENSDEELGRRYLREGFPELTAEYFEAAAQHRYELYPHIPEVAAFESFKDRSVLEIGVGHGIDHLMFARGGARLSGIDVTPKHCATTQHCLGLFGFQSRIVRADARRLPFREASFDHVFACGVLLLFREIDEALSEIHRVLRPGGFATIMLYNQASLHYWLKTRLYYGWVLDEDAVLGPETVTDWYTDGIGYPRTHHYQPADLPRLFTQFSRIEYRTACLTPEQVPRVGLPADPVVRRWLENHFGFFLWVRAWR
jgi:SAM-dependent methyltransferase